MFAEQNGAQQSVLKCTKDSINISHMKTLGEETESRRKTFHTRPSEKNYEILLHQSGIPSWYYSSYFVES